MSENSSEIKQVDKFNQAHPQKKENSKKTQKDKLDIKRLARTGLLSMLVTYGGMTLTEDLLASIPQENKPPGSPQALVSENKNETKYSLSEQEIEDKYNINLFTMKEGAQALGWTYDEQNEKMIGQAPPVRWREDQLMMTDDLLSLLPTKLYSTTTEGKKLGIMLSDFGSDCECGGASYPGTGIIGVSNEGFDPSDREGAFSLLAHELTHRIDTPELRNEVQKILGNEFYSELDQLDLDLDSDPDKSAAISTIKLISKGDFTEPIANISQFYVRGYERFMHAIGPLVDGEGYPDLEAENNKPLGVDSLPVAYPKTQALYDLYKQMIFDGKVYDEKELEKVKYTEAELIQKATELKQALEDTELLISGLKREYNIEIVKDSSVSFNLFDLELLKDAVNVLPEDFYNKDGEPKQIIITEDVTKVSSSKDNALVVLGWRGSFGGVNNLVRAIGYEGALHKNEETGFDFQNEIVEILGGDEFIKSPGSLYPRLKETSEEFNVINREKSSIFYTGENFGVNKEETFAKLAQAYLGGWEYFSFIVGTVIDPDVVLDDIDVDHSKTKTARIYWVLKDFYGDEFLGSNDSGIPISINKSEIISPLL